MLKLVEKRRNPPLRRSPLTAGQRVSRKYRRANIRRIEYKKLKAIVPSIAAKNRVTKVEVIEEAIKYIDELHQALYSRVPLIYGNGLPPFLPEMSPECALVHLLRRVAPQSNLSSTTSQGRSTPPSHQSFSSSAVQNNQTKELPQQRMPFPNTQWPGRPYHPSHSHQGPLWGASTSSTGALPIGQRGIPSQSRKLLNETCFL